MIPQDYQGRVMTFRQLRLHIPFRTLSMVVRALDIRYNPGAASYHMDDTQLDSYLRENSPYRIGETSKAIHVDDKDVIDPTVLQVSNEPHSELYTLSLAEVEAHDFLVSFHIYS